MRANESPAFPFNPASVYDRQLQQALADWMRRAAVAINSRNDEHWSGLITSPSDKTYTLVLKTTFGGTIRETTTKSASGTCTATFKINTTALGGTANSVSSTETSQLHTSANQFAPGDDIVVTVSSNSSCADFAFTIKYDRVLT
jgi:hypothetical protein